ncbi:MAG: choice-of-anchor J domain-containing protein [Bryobacteraceae bacterium]
MRITNWGKAVGLFLAVMGQCWAAVIFSEQFNDISTLNGSGWVQINNSVPAGPSSAWFQGNSGIFPAHAGAATAYIATNFDIAPSGADLSNWLLTPTVNVNNGYVFSFFTRTEAGSPFADRLQVRFSSNGASTDVGTTATSVGDFTSLLLAINPGVSSGGYPENWTQFSITFSGLSGLTAGRLALWYTVPDNSVNGNYIGIDTVTLSDANVVIPEPASVILVGIALGGLGWRRRRKG